MDRQIANPRYARNAACPQCGSLLEVMPRKRTVHNHRIADDDREIDARVIAGVVDRRFEHVTSYRCPGCGGEWSHAQTCLFDPEAHELPADFWLDDEVTDPETAVRICELFKASLFDAEKKRELDELVAGMLTKKEE